MRRKRRTSPDLLDFEQAGDRLNVSSATVRRLVAAGKLASIPVSPSGKHRMIRLVDIDDYIRTRVELVRGAEAEQPRTVTVPEREFLKRAGWDGKNRL